MIEHFKNLSLKLAVHEVDRVAKHGNTLTRETFKYGRIKCTYDTGVYTLYRDTNKQIFQSDKRDEVISFISLAIFNQ